MKFLIRLRIRVVSWMLSVARAMIERLQTMAETGPKEQAALDSMDSTLESLEETAAALEEWSADEDETDAAAIAARNARLQAAMARIRAVIPVADVPPGNVVTPGGDVIPDPQGPGDGQVLDEDGNLVDAEPVDEEK